MRAQCFALHRRARRVKAVAVMTMICVFVNFFNGNVGLHFPIESEYAVPAKEKIDECASRNDTTRTNGTLNRCDFPPTVKTCNVSALTFDPSKFYKVSAPTVFIPNHTAQVAYGPWLTKCGSTSTVRVLRGLAGTTENLESKIKDDAVKNNYTFISFIRHPMERALAGFHQFEVFFQKGWINRDIEEYNLTWWNTSCINTTYGEADRKYICTGSEPSRTILTRLHRFNSFLNEMERHGFFDQHITPTSYLLATSPVVQSKNAFLFDIKNMGEVHSTLSAAFEKNLSSLVHSNKRPALDPDDPMGMHWQVGWVELVQWSETMPLAKKVVEQLCSLYRHDVECLPYQVPECNYDETALKAFLK